MVVLKPDAGDPGKKTLFEDVRRFWKKNCQEPQSQSQKKRNQNRAEQARFSKLCKAGHLFLQHSPVTRRNLEWPPITASRHVGFAQLICFFGPFFHGFPRKSDGTEANFECLRRRCDKTYFAEQHSVPRFMHYNNFNVAMVFKFHAGDLEWKTTCSKTWKGKPQGNTKPRKRSKHRIPPKESLPKEI